MEDLLLLFNENVKKISLNSSIEQNNFALVRKYLHGRIVESEYGVDSSSLEKEFIIKNIDEIKNKISSSNYCGNFKLLLQEKIMLLSRLFDEFVVYDNLLQKYKLNKAEKKLSSENLSKIFYLILELRVSLGLDLDDIYYEEIMSYCDIIASDVNNGKYKRLDFQSHIGNTGNLIRFK